MGVTCSSQHPSASGWPRSSTEIATRWRGGLGPRSSPPTSRQRTTNPTLGVRIGEAKKPGQRVPRYDVDLRVRVFGGETTRAKRARLLERFHQWLAVSGRDSLDQLAADPEHLDQALSDYGQHFWSNDASQGDFAEYLKHIKKLYLG